MTEDELKRETEEPQPFATILELIAEHGFDGVIDAVATHCEFDSEDEELDLRDRLLGGYLYLELDQLRERQLHFEEILDAILPEEAEVREEVQV